MYTQKSYTLKPSEADRKWYHIDATDKIVGRLATELADILEEKEILSLLQTLILVISLL
jgi:large subunit ribosomal protein L13